MNSSSDNGYSGTPEDDACVPLVSIIIPCYNAERYLKEAIQSALDQTHPNCEVIVIDDGSTDRSRNVSQAFGEKIRFETGPNRGACAARNRGIRLAKGKYLKFLDADDYLMPDCVAVQVSISEALPPHAICYGAARDYETGEPVYNEVRTSLGMSQDEMLTAYYTGIIMITCPLHRRESLVLEELYFDERLKRGQEWNLHLRIVLSGVKFVYHDHVVFRYRRHAGVDRISNLAGSRRLLAEVEKDTLTDQLILKKLNGQLPEDLRMSMATRAHGLSRLLFRAGYHQEGGERHKFYESLGCDLGKMIPHWYRVLTKFVSPYRVEQWIRPLLRWKALMIGITEPLRARVATYSKKSPTDH